MYKYEAHILSFWFSWVLQEASEVETEANLEA